MSGSYQANPGSWGRHRVQPPRLASTPQQAYHLPTVAALLGHSRLDTVRLSAHPDAAALERAAVVLDAD